MFNYDDFIISEDLLIPKTFILKDYGNGYQKLMLGRFKRSGFEQILKNDIPDDDYIPDFDEVHRISISRSKRVVRELAVCNDFKYFVTLTLNSSKCDRYSLEECQDLMHNSFKNYQRRCKRSNLDFKYVVITECHKDGAYHFHGLFSCVIPDDIYINNEGFFSSHYFDTCLGFNSFSKVNNIDACSKYITKYITKDCVINSHHQCYFCSKGLRRPTVYRLPVYVEDENILKDYWNDKISNEFVKCFDFNIDNLPIDLKLWLQYKRDFDYERKIEIEENVNKFFEKILKN